MSEIKDKIRAFIVENFLYGNDGKLKDETSFLEEGILDSTGVLELVAFIEENYNFKIEDEELIPENLDSIKNISRFIEEKLGRVGELQYRSTAPLQN